MAKSWHVDPALMSPWTNVAAGATQALPNVFPGGVGIGRRTEPRNTFRGMILTRPAEETVVLGLVYDDLKDAGDNEDIYKYDTKSSTLTPYMRGTFAEEFPEYEGYHRASKHFLL